MSEKLSLGELDTTKIEAITKEAETVLYNLGLLDTTIPYCSNLSWANINRICVELKNWNNIPYIQHPKLRYDSYNGEDSESTPNFMCNAGVRILATNFIEKLDFNAILDCVDVSLVADIPDCVLNHKEVYSIIYSLLCLRNEILKADYTRRNIVYNPIHNFYNYMYYPFSKELENTLVNWKSMPDVFTSIICCLFSDIALDLFSMYSFGKKIRENNPAYVSDFIFNSKEISYLETLKGLAVINTKNSNTLLNSLLLRIIESFNLLNAMIRQIPCENTSSTEIQGIIRNNDNSSKVTTVLLLQLLFKKVASLENYVAIL